MAKLKVGSDRKYPKNGRRITMPAQLEEKLQQIKAEQALPVLDEAQAPEPPAPIPPASPAAKKPQGAASFLPPDVKSPFL